MIKVIIIQAFKKVWSFVGVGWIIISSVLYLDAEPPVFIYCPRSIVRYADRGSDIATYVTWDKPIIIDNAQQGEACGEKSKPSLKQIGGLEPESDFSKGYHLIEYEAIDGNKNTAFCSFNIIIESKQCFYWKKNAITRILSLVRYF